MLNACWIRSSMVLMDVPSLPTSVWSSASGIRAVRSPMLVISLAAAAMSSSGSRPRPISHSPMTASRVISAAPVMSWAMMNSRTSPGSLLTGWATNRIACRAGELAGAIGPAGPAVTSRVAVWICRAESITNGAQFRYGKLDAAVRTPFRAARAAEAASADAGDRGADGGQLALLRELPDAAQVGAGQLAVHRGGELAGERAGGDRHGLQVRLERDEHDGVSPAE